MFDQVNGYFILMDYYRTHSQLLIRKEDVINAKPHNTDVIFDAVMYIELLPYLPDLQMRLGTKAEEKMIAKRANRTFHYGHLMKLFVLKTRGRNFYIVAGQCRIVTNTLEHNVSSLSRFLPG